MSRKILAWILAGIISVLLISGCSSGAGEQNGTDADAAQTGKEENGASVLPSEAGVGIAYTEGEEEYTAAFIQKLREYFTTAGVPEDQIREKSGSAGEIAGLAGELIDSGCSVLVIGNADPGDVPEITNAADKAGVPVLYFGTDPGEKETDRWEKKKLRAAYVGSTCQEAPAKRADVLEAVGLEEIDQSGDEEIGVIVLGSGEEKPGDAVNQETVNALKERGLPVLMLQEESDESGEDTDTADEALTEEAADEEPERDEEEAGTAEEAQDEADTEETENDPAMARRDAAKEEVIRCMEEYGNELEVILCSDDTQALGALDAVSEEKRLVGHDVLIFGFECSSESLREAAAGNIISTFFRDFMEQSKITSEAALAFLKGESAQARTSCEYVSVTVDNAQEILDITLKALDAGGTDEGEDTDSGETEDGEDPEEGEADGEDAVVEDTGE